MAFPITRLRRLRQNEALRSMVRETRLTPESLVYPLFVCPGKGVRRAIGSMPGVFNLSIDEAVSEARETHSLGIPAVILFGLPESKDEQASGAWAQNGIVQSATRAIKDAVPELLVIADVCLCEYMSHGHCGIVKRDESRGENGCAGARPGLKNAGRGSASSSAAVAAVQTSSPAGRQQFEIDNDATLDILARTAVSQ